VSPYRPGSQTTARLRATQRGLPPTPIQLRALDLLSRGHDLRQVARLMNVSINTTKIHVRRLYARLDVDTAAHAVRVGFERRLLTVDDGLGDGLVDVPEEDLEDEVEA
jgi:DNA-binding CsgD family transcriptional regulator